MSFTPEVLRRSMVVVMLVLVSGLVMGTGPVNAGPFEPPPDFPIAPRGKAAIEALGSRLPSVAIQYGLSATNLRDLFLNDPTLSVDSGGELYYIDDPFPGDASAAQNEAVAITAAPLPEAQTFLLHSLPGARHTIYLDFDGHVTTGTTWNNAYGVPTIVSPPYDTDGNPSTFSSLEIERIQRVWLRVAEDFRPFQVDVTTEDPGAEALSYQGAGDLRWGTRVVITDDTFANCGCGGHAYIGSFDDPADEPVFVYNSSELGVSEASSHEVGHALNLSHDGSTGVTYYQGHGSGETSWAPIMGVSYYVNIGQWDRGEYYDSNNGGPSANYGNGPDDLAVITSLSNGNGFGYRSDDHGNSLGQATALTQNGSALNGVGIIERTTDVDVFRFTTAAGTITLDVTPHAPGPNLDVLAELYDGSGAPLVRSDPSAVIAASISLDVEAGTYYLVIDGTGTGNPFVSPPSGYTDYGSLGQYSISGTITDPGNGDTSPPSPPANLLAIAGDGLVDLYWDANPEDDVAGYTVYRSSSSGGPYAAITSALLSATTYTDQSVNNGDDYYYVVTASDFTGNISTYSEEASVTPTGPGTPDLASGDYATASGTIAGTYAATQIADGVYQVLSEAHSGGKPASRFDLLDHTWSFNLTGGNHIFNVKAYYLDAGDADSGFGFFWATGPTGSWQPLVTVNHEIDTGGYLSADFGSGATGNIYVRAVDFDRTPGQNSNDILYVDHMVITGGGPPAEKPQPASQPYPEDGASGVPLNVTLSWQAGLGATSHDVYFGAEGEQPTPINVTGTSHDPGTLLPGQSYVWRVDERNDLGSTSGPVWTFTTQDVPTSMTVQAIRLDTVSADRGAKLGQATISVVDNYGHPVSGATVVGYFTGDLAENRISEATDAAGITVVTGSIAAKKPIFSFCVEAITLVQGELPYTGGPICETY